MSSEKEGTSNEKLSDYSDHSFIPYVPLSWVSIYLQTTIHAHDVQKKQTAHDSRRLYTGIAIKRPQKQQSSNRNPTDYPSALQPPRY